jgi:hypothetical protein
MPIFMNAGSVLLFEGFSNSDVFVRTIGISCIGHLLQFVAWLDEFKDEGVLTGSLLELLLDFRLQGLYFPLAFDLLT